MRKILTAGDDTGHGDPPPKDPPPKVPQRAPGTPTSIEGIGGA